MSNRMRITAFVAVPVIVVLGIVSYHATLQRGESFWPLMELRVHLRDTNGKPVKKAQAALYLHGVLQQAFQKNFFHPKDWSSDENGELRILVRNQRWQSDGFHLFWFIPMGHIAPDRDYEIRVDCPGYRTLRIPFTTLYEEGRDSVGKRKMTDIEKSLENFFEDDVEIFEGEFVLQPLGNQ